MEPEIATRIIARGGSGASSSSRPQVDTGYDPQYVQHAQDVALGSAPTQLHLHDGGYVKSGIHRALENSWLELFILLLVFVDVALVSVEAGVDYQAICIHGEVVPYGSPAGEHLVHDEHGHASLLGKGMASNALSLPRAVRQRGSALDVEDFGIRLQPEHGPIWDQVGDRAGATAGMFLSGATAAQAELTQHAPVEASVTEHQASFHVPAATGESHSHGTPVLVCEGPEGHEVHHIVHTCHFWSVAILCIFTAELALKIWVIPGFLEDPFHQLDCFVVILSLLVDTLVMWLIESMKEDDEEAMDKGQRELDIVAGLLLVSRLWRVVRIVHGLYEFSSKEEEVKEKIREHMSGTHLGEGHHGQHVGDERA